MERTVNSRPGRTDRVPGVRRIRRIATGLGMIGFTALLIPQGIVDPTDASSFRDAAVQQPVALLRLRSALAGVRVADVPGDLRHPAPGPRPGRAGRRHRSRFRRARCARPCRARHHLPDHAFPGGGDAAAMMRLRGTVQLRRPGRCRRVDAAAVLRHRDRTAGLGGLARRAHRRLGTGGDHRGRRRAHGASRRLAECGAGHRARLDRCGLRMARRADHTVVGRRMGDSLRRTDHDRRRPTQGSHPPAVTTRDASPVDHRRQALDRAWFQTASADQGQRDACCSIAGPSCAGRRRRPIPRIGPTAGERSGAAQDQQTVQHGRPRRESGRQCRRGPASVADPKRVRDCTRPDLQGQCRRTRPRVRREQQIPSLRDCSPKFTRPLTSLGGSSIRMWARRRERQTAEFALLERRGHSGFAARVRVQTLHGTRAGARHGCPKRASRSRRRRPSGRARPSRLR